MNYNLKQYEKLSILNIITDKLYRTRHLTYTISSQKKKIKLFKMCF